MQSLKTCSFEEIHTVHKSTSTLNYTTLHYTRLQIAISTASEGKKRRANIGMHMAWHMHTESLSKGTSLLVSPKYGSRQLSQGEYEEILLVYE